MTSENTKEPRPFSIEETHHLKSISRQQHFCPEVTLANELRFTSSGALNHDLRLRNFLHSKIALRTFRGNGEHRNAGSATEVTGENLLRVSGNGRKRHQIV